MMGPSARDLVHTDNKSEHTLSKSRNAGVTLLEVLVVLAIIAMIASLAAPRLLENFGRAKSQVAEVQLTTLKAAVQIYHLDTGELPSQSQGLGALIDAPAGLTGWNGPYIEDSQLLDPWGRLPFG